MTQERLDELRQWRARDMLTVIERHQPPPESRMLGVPRTGAPVKASVIPPAAAQPDDAPARHAGDACSARELEWIAQEVSLRANPAVRAGTVARAHVGVVSPYTPSMLVVIFAARYFLAPAVAPAAAPTAGVSPAAAVASPADLPPRDVYVSYGAGQAMFLPTTRGTGGQL